MIAMESKPQGEQTGEWVKEVGKSECLAVMVWIRAYMLPARKCADFRQVLNHEKYLDSITFMVWIDDDSKSH